MAMASTATDAHLKTSGGLPMNGIPDNKSRPPTRSPPPSGCLHTHVNSLWSVWYGLCIAALETYIAVHNGQKFIMYAALPASVAISSFLELTAYAILTSIGALLIPLFVASAVLRVGNMANDGCKLGRHLGACSSEPTASVTTNAVQAPATTGATIRALWLHGGPTAAFLHVTSALCLLLPGLIMEARMIHSGYLPKETLWRTDLDWLMLPHDRRLVQNVVARLNSSATVLETQQPQIALQDDDRWGPMSAELINYGVALIVYSVRYPAVFWYTNKAFGAVFSIQLLANSFQCLILYAGVCILYKIHLYGAPKVLPLLHHRSAEIAQPFLLNTIVTLCLFVLCTVLVLSSSLVFYLYGYGRFTSFLEADKSRRRHTTSTASTQSTGAPGATAATTVAAGTGASWTAFTHCAALCVFICCTVSVAPLLHDLAVVYRGSLDGTSLTTIIVCISHLLLWILLWLILTIKQSWVFKLRVAVGRAVMRSARSVKLVTEVELAGEAAGEDEASATVPLLVLSHGRTYAIADVEPKKAILGVVQQLRGKRGSDDVNDDSQEQIYWLRPKPPSLKNSPDSATDKITWLASKQGSSDAPNTLPAPVQIATPKHKVTFVDTVRNGNVRNSRGKGHTDLEDDGDYATLKELPIENKLLETVRAGNVTYVNATDYEDPSPLLTPDLPLGGAETETEDTLPPLPSPTPPSPLPPTPSLPPPPPLLQGQQTVGPIPTLAQASVLLRRADSGVPSRSESVSTDSSGCGGSPARDVETSSGVHSNSSGDNQQQRRANSVTDLCVPNLCVPNHTGNQWKSCSLQRNVLPPPASGIMQPIYAFGGAHKPMVPQLIPQVTSQVNASTVPTSSSPPPPPPPNSTAPTDIQMAGCLAVLLESSDSTVVIRRTQLARPKPTPPGQRPSISEEPFGRSTNMRMTSFTDHPDYGKACVSTLPHYPTQPPIVEVGAHGGQRCATLPTHGSYVTEQIHTSAATGSSCQSFPRPHTTIPTHHNGVRLFSGSPGVRVCAPQNGHALVQGLSPTIKYSLQQHLRSDRDFIANRNPDIYLQYRS